jgi:hypothetical protein
MSGEVPLGGKGLRSSLLMRVTLQVFWMRTDAIAVVDSLAQHVLCPKRGLFEADGPPGRKSYINT